MTVSRWFPQPSLHRRADAMLSWGRAKDALLVVALVIAGGGVASSLGTFVSASRDNRTIADLATGKDRSVDAGSRLQVRVARINFLLQHDRIDEAQLLVSEIKAVKDPPPDPQLLADVQYNLANARLRAAFVLIEQGKIDAATSSVGIAKAGYRAALSSDPEHWDARYNLDVAMRLVRDFSPVDQNPEETSQEPPKRLWTDLPGTPKGLP